jgi:hypothetical protein
MVPNVTAAPRADGGGSRAWVNAMGIPAGLRYRDYGNATRDNPQRQEGNVPTHLLRRRQAMRACVDALARGRVDGRPASRTLPPPCDWPTYQDAKGGSTFHGRAEVATIDCIPSANRRHDAEARRTARWHAPATRVEPIARAALD